ncbi:nitrogen fixation protein NifZ [Azoarcus sp. KH32C]|uniref:nitrogen fixation protein NifZ n=1 Tax=Azoarcus sp. KH32C TaxID=748247 RepID=UPI0002386675|nr:nitrogen fixation protein NifZ [Azoarcus sp. KH32C]BAL26345.1 putative nitorogen fixation protein [Azoarcus sp. KH32C]
MMDLRLPKFDWGMRVVAVADLLNDGSYPERAPDALLAGAGTIGEVVQVGRHTETDTPVYLVEFPDGSVIGCLEEEIVRAP